MADNPNTALPRKVLVVDNDQLILNQLQQQLKVHNITVVQAKDWQSGLYLFNQQRFDVCIVELELEDMTGMTLIQKWRSHATVAKRDTGFVVISGMQRKPQDDALISELEDISIITKPISIPQLLGILATSMKKKEQREKFSHIQYNVVDPLIKQGKIDKAMDIAEKKLEPIGPKGRFYSAILHDNAGQTEQAFHLLEGLNQEDPKNIKYLNELGRISLKMGNLKHAKELFEVADKVAPLNLDRLNYMADMYLNLKDPDKTVSKYSEILSVNPETPDIKFDMYDKLINSGFEKQARDFSKKTSSPKELIRHFNNKGVVYSKNGQFVEAIDEYRKSLKLLPESGDVYRIMYNMAIAHINLKSRDNIQKADTLLEQCLKLQPTFDKALEKRQITSKYLQSNPAELPTESKLETRDSGIPEENQVKKAG